jgi:hypothetical protein
MIFKGIIGEPEREGPISGFENVFILDWTSWQPPQ